MKIRALFFFVSLFLIKTVWADLSISPFYLLFNADSNKRTDIVRFTNNSVEKKTYRIRMVNYKQLEDGRYTEISEALPNNPFASPYVNFAPHETTLEPRQSQTIRVQRKAMPVAPDGEYVSHLMIQEMPNDVRPSKTDNDNKLRIDIKALYGITIPVIIDKGDLKAMGKISQARLISGTKPEVAVLVNRQGTKSFWGTLVVTEKGKEIGRVNEFKIFLTTPNRLVKVPLSQKPNGKIKVTLWDARTNEMVMEKIL